MKRQEITYEYPKNPKNDPKNPNPIKDLGTFPGEILIRVLFFLSEDITLVIPFSQVSPRINILTKRFICELFSIQPKLRSKELSVEWYHFKKDIDFVFYKEKIHLSTIIEGIKKLGILEAENIISNILTLDLETLKKPRKRDIEKIDFSLKDPSTKNNDSPIDYGHFVPTFHLDIISNFRYNIISNLTCIEKILDLLLYYLCRINVCFPQFESLIELPIILPEFNNINRIVKVYLEV
jgi:hypothetical protein